MNANMPALDYIARDTADALYPMIVGITERVFHDNPGAQLEDLLDTIMYLEGLEDVVRQEVPYRLEEASLSEEEVDWVVSQALEWAWEIVRDKLKELSNER